MQRTPDTKVAAKLTPALQRFLANHGAVEHLRPMEDGHAGLTFGFELVGASGDVRSFILKKAPEGVPSSGSTDVFRQAALLRALSRSGFPAPDVPWADDGVKILGAPFIVMERLPGRSVIVWDPSPDMTAQFADPEVMWTQSAQLMGTLHAFDWRRELNSWKTPTDLTRELDRWARLLRHMQDQAAVETAQSLVRELAQAIPKGVPLGLVHGDFQPGNVLFKNGRAQGLIDWDLADIGPIGMDVGWLLMVADRQSWAHDWRPYGAPPRSVILDAYYRAGGVPIPDIDWYQAFSHFRMAAITGLNLKLHRDGRKHDPIWERFASSVPLMLSRGLALMQQTRKGAT